MTTLFFMKLIKETFTQNLHIYLRADGIIVTKTLALPENSSELELAKENMIAIEKFMGEKNYPMVNYLPYYSVSNEARKFYSNHKPLGLCSAMITHSFIQKILGNFFLNFNKLQIPLRLFSSEEDAFKWAGAFIKENDN
ncbi:MAG: hypothetical protein ACI9WO_000437 [Sphingobacteriales bacterium]